MWIAFAVLSAFFAGITAILSKIGIKSINSDLGTAIRTVVVFAFAWLMVFVAGVQGEIMTVKTKTLVFLIMSGFATGASWLCYFKALKYGDVNKVAPIDKSSTILTILLAFVFLREKITPLKILCVILIASGTYLMIEKRDTVTDSQKRPNWFILAVMSAIFAALASILGKIGISDIDSTLGTAIRTSVVLVMAWVIVKIKDGTKDTKNINAKTSFYLVISGVTTGLSWLCYYRALRDGPASIVVPIDKLSILVTIAFSYIVFKEKLTKKATLGLILLVGGTLLLLL